MLICLGPEVSVPIEATECGNIKSSHKTWQRNEEKSTKKAATLLSQKTTSISNCLDKAWTQ
jgi:hypothetical protein